MQDYNVYDQYGFFKQVIRAKDSLDAIDTARRLGIFAPMVESHSEIQQREREAENLHWRNRYEL